MAGRAHDVLTQALRDDPLLLRALLGKLTGRAPPGRLESIDSAVRFTQSPEVRPDVVYRAGRSWLVCEVQNKRDDIKARSWLVAMATLRFHHGQMGDLVVITTSRAVARWALKVAHERGQAGTTSRLTPVVLLLDPRRARELLDPSRPELALCAAWAMHKRHGPEAVRILQGAAELTDRLPPPLRDAQRRAILEVLSDRLRSRLLEVTMHPDRVRENHETDELWRLLQAAGEKRGLVEGEKRGLAEGEKRGLAEGKRESLHLILAERGLRLTPANRARIDGCSDIPQLDAWLRRAITAETAAAVLASDAAAPAERSTQRRTPPRRPARGAKNGTHA